MADKQPPQQVVITDIKIPFMSMMNLLITAALACIPVAIILMLLTFFLGAMLHGSGHVAR